MTNIYIYSNKRCLKSRNNHKNKGRALCLLSQLVGNSQVTLFYPIKCNVILISFLYS